MLRVRFYLKIEKKKKNIQLELVYSRVKFALMYYIAFRVRTHGWLVMLMSDGKYLPCGKVNIYKIGFFLCI